MAEQPPWEEVERTGVTRRVRGDEWYRAHIERFRPAVIREDADPADVAFYEQAVAADLAEQSLAAIRESLVRVANTMGGQHPPEPKRDAAKRVLEAIRPTVVREDADPRNVSFFETCVAANAAREAFAPIFDRVTAGGLEFERRHGRR